MTQGPLGGPRPLASHQCKITIYIRGVGREDDIRERLAEFEEEIILKQKYVPPHGRTVYTNLPSKQSVSNTVVAAIGLSDRAYSPQTLMDLSNEIKRKFKRITGVARVDIMNIESGNPQDIIE